MNSNHLFKFLEILKIALPPGRLSIADDRALEASTNTLGIYRRVPAVLYPQSRDEVQKIVELADEYRVALYTVSQGKNIGYGEITPTGENQVVMNLKNLNAIREYDEVYGEIVVEPGVTQAQLARFLKEKGSHFCADVTGASPGASIIGNTLEAGFGHTPLGDHRKHILDMEVILADGSLMSTGEMPGVGPDLSQLFIQSNFGIITALRIPLFRIPEKTVSFSLSFKTENDYLKGLSKLSELRQLGVINSLIHCGNATRTLMTSQRFPENLDPSIVLDEEASRQILCKDSLLKFGAWTGFGGVYGSKAEVQEKVRKIKKAFKGMAQVRFFTELKISFAENALSIPLIQNFSKIQNLKKSVRTLRSLHGLLLGQPTDLPSESIFWRVDSQDRLGIAWHAPVVPAREQDVRLLLNSARPIFEKYGFEMPITMTLINQKKMTVVFNINFDKADPDSVDRAHQAYKELSMATAALGYYPYRLGLLSDAKVYLGSRKFRVLQAIKGALDPHQTLAPGRYGLGLSHSDKEVIASKDLGREN